MKNVLCNVKMLLLIVLMGILTTSCQKDEKEKSVYQLRIQNEMNLDLLGLPIMKYNIVECKLGDLTFSDIAYGEYSNRLSIKSSTDYNCTVKIEVFNYNVDAFSWESSGYETYDMGTISWVDDEDYTNLKLKFEIGDLLQGYKPVYTKYAEQ